MGFWKNFDDSFKDNKEGYSERKITAFWFMVLTTFDLLAIIILAYLRTFKAVQIQDSTMSIVFDTLTYTFVLLLIVDATWAGLLTIPAIMELLQVYRGNKFKSSEVTVTTEKTTTENDTK
jgi:fumarate reductase subunit D